MLHKIFTKLCRLYQFMNRMLKFDKPIDGTVNRWYNKLKSKSITVPCGKRSAVKLNQEQVSLILYVPDAKD